MNQYQKRFEVLCDKCNLRPSVTKLLKLHPKRYRAREKQFMTMILHLSRMKF